MSQIYRRGGGFYHECPNCGASLDPGETCECCKQETQEEEKDPLATIIENLERELGISHEGN